MAELSILVLTGDPRLPDASKRDQRYNEEDLATFHTMREALGSLPGFLFDFLDDHSALLDRLRLRPPDLVLNFCDTGYRNNAARELHIPALLGLLGIPYSGAPPAAIAVCLDKQIVSLVAESRGVPVPNEVCVEATDAPATLPFPFPALIKPNQADGSLGITRRARVASAEEARAYLRWLDRTLPGRAALIQEYLPGPEYTVGLIGNPARGLEALPVLEVDYSGLPAGLVPILPYESKAIPDSPYWTDIRYRPTQAKAGVVESMIRHSKVLFERLGLRDYGRFDFRAGADGIPRLMDVNPNPAWASDGKLALMAGFAGLPYAAMLRSIVESALCRLSRR